MLRFSPRLLRARPRDTSSRSGGSGGLPSHSLYCGLREGAERVEAIRNLTALTLELKGRLRFFLVEQGEDSVFLLIPEDIILAPKADL